jgi:tRNA(Arg) A34 adenosine deaminase TadA
VSHSEMVLRLPHWVGNFLASQPPSFPRVADRMELVIRLAEQNLARESGGPFGAAIFEVESGVLVSAGVNAVVSSGCSLAHAEMMAIALAHRVLGHYDLGGPGMAAHELVVSAEPCAMCFGAILWSGLRRLVCGAPGEDARAIGFDEGPKPADWVKALESRGIAVRRDVSRGEAAALLRSYRERGGVIYNARQGEQPSPAPRSPGKIRDA